VWSAFGDLITQRIAFLADRLNGNYAKLTTSMFKDMEILAELVTRCMLFICELTFKSSHLLKIHGKIRKVQERPKWKKIALFREDPSLLATLKENLNDALNQFTVCIACTVLLKFTTP
jgi:hypothetical protein